MRILHVVAGLSKDGGGLSELVPMFARGAAGEGHSVVVATVARDTDPLSLATEKAQKAGVRVVRFAPFPPRFLYFSAEMLIGLRRLVTDADIVHVHSNWTFPVWWACHEALRRGKGLVLSPHGCLCPERLRRSAWKKRLAGRVFDRRYVRKAALIHATSQQEAEDIEAYLGSACVPRVAVIPNGIDLGDFVAKGNGDLRKGTEKRTVLFLSRIHPLKGLGELLVAWRRVCDSFPGWQLMIAGPDENGYSRELKRDVSKLGVEASVSFCGPLYGEAKTKALSRADVFVLPTRHENFGIVVAEALACGVPVITTKAAPWSELLGSSEGCGRCGWWIDLGEEQLAQALGEAMNMSDEQLQAMGREGQRLTEARYQWPAVSRQMEKVYQLALMARSSNGDMQ